MSPHVSYAETETAEEVEVLAVIEKLQEAVRATDVEAWLAHCAHGITTFDMVAPLKHEGADAIRRVWAETIAQFDGPIEYDSHDLEIFVDGDVAFTRSLTRFSPPEEQEASSEGWMCETLGLRRIDGLWKLVHSHVSVPFNMETGQALLDLEPERAG